MKGFRSIAAVLLLVYGAIVLGINFHSHPGGQDQIGIHCKLCQVSQISLENASGHSVAPLDAVIQNSPDELLNFSHEKRVLRLHGRSPPFV